MLIKILSRFIPSKRIVFASIISFILGVTSMYLYTLNWVVTTKHNTEDLVYNFQITYDIL